MNQILNSLEGETQVWSRTGLFLCLPDTASYLIQRTRCKLFLAENKNAKYKVMD
jgi:hypothetical protein